MHTFRNQALNSRDEDPTFFFHGSGSDLKVLYEKLRVLQGYSSVINPQFLFWIALPFQCLYWRILRNMGNVEDLKCFFSSF